MEKFLREQRTREVTESAYKSTASFFTCTEGRKQIGWWGFNSVLIKYFATFFRKSWIGAFVRCKLSKPNSFPLSRLSRRSIDGNMTNCHEKRKSCANLLVATVTRDEVWDKYQPRLSPLVASYCLANATNVGQSSVRMNNLNNMFAISLMNKRRSTMTMWCLVVRILLNRQINYLVTVLSKRSNCKHSKLSNYSRLIQVSWLGISIAVKLNTAKESTDHLRTWNENTSRTQNKYEERSEISPMMFMINLTHRLTRRWN